MSSRETNSIGSWLKKKTLVHPRKCCLLQEVLAAAPPSREVDRYFFHQTERIAEIGCYFFSWISANLLNSVFLLLACFISSLLCFPHSLFFFLLVAASCFESNAVNTHYWIAGMCRTGMLTVHFYFYLIVCMVSF